MIGPMTLRIRLLPLTLLMTLACLGMSGHLHSTGALSGFFADISPLASVNLSGLGATDWSHWGYLGNPGFDHQAGGGQIGGLIAVGGGVINQNNDTSTPLFSWNTGTPDASVTNTENQLYMTNIGGGFQFSAPADTTVRTLTIYVGMTGSSTGTLVAHLSDGSAADYVSGGVTSSSGYREVLFTITYNANSAGQNLSLTWSLTSGSVIFLHAAALGTSGSSGLNGSLSAISPSASVNLSSQGGTDWAHWGYLSNPGFDHDASGGNQIGNVSPFNGASILQNSDTGTPLFSWSGGTPDTSVTNTQNQLYTTSVGAGFQFQVPAGTGQQTIQIYVGMTGATSGKLQAHLSDGSSPDYIDTGATSAGSYQEFIYSISYRAASPGQTLTLTWSLVSGTVIFLHAAVLGTTGPGSLSGSFTDISPNASVTLTGQGVDWAHWGYLGNPGFDHMASGGSQISNVGAAGGAAISQNSDVSTPLFSWSDGNPDLSVANTQNQLYTTTTGGGFQFSVPAGLSPATLKVYVGMTGVTSGKLQAHLSDSSAADFIDGSVSSTGGYREVIYTLNYRAGSGGQSLAVTWSLVSGSVVFLHAAVLGSGSTTLTGTYSDISPSSSVNLTSLGASDWTHWGYLGNPGFDHMSAGGSQVSSVSPFNSAVFNQTNDVNTPLFSWNDGTPDGVVGGTQNQIYAQTVGGGFQFTAPADLTQRILKIYVGMTGTTSGKLQAHLSDGSSPDYVDTGVTTAGPYREGIYTITYHAASPAQSLTVDWSLVSGSVIFLHASALFNSGLPTPTPSPSPSPTAPTPSATPTASATPSASPSGTATSTPSASPTMTGSPSDTSTPTATPSVSPSDTPSATPTVSCTATPTMSPSGTSSPTPSASPTVSSTASPSVSPSDTPSATPSASPTVSCTATLTMSPSGTSSQTPSASPTVSSTASPSISPSDTPSPTPSASATVSSTVVSSSTFSASPTGTSSATASASPSATLTHSMSPTLTASPSGTSSATATPSPAATNTPIIPATPTPSPSASATALATFTPPFSPTQSALATQSFTQSATYSITQTPVPSATPFTPAVLSTNVFRPEQGGTLTVSANPSQDGKVTVKLYDIGGHLIRPIFDGDVKAGIWFQAHWDGHNDDGSLVSSGIYFVSVHGAGIKTILKVILLK
jgi:hypothetical protein